MATITRGERKAIARRVESAKREKQAKKLAESENRPDTTTTQEAYEKKQPVAQVKTEVIHEEVITETLAENPSQLEEDKGRDFRYPLSMPASGKGYPGTITFEAHIVKGVDLAKEMSGIYNKLARNRKEIRDESEADEENRQSIIDANKKANNTNNAEDAALQNEIIATGQSANSKSYENLNANNPVGSVILPLQRDLRFSDNVSYESPAIGMMGAGLEGAIGGKNPFDGATNGDGSFTTAASALAAQAIAKASGLGVGALIGKIAGGALGGAVLGSGATEGLGDAVKSATRIASAPNQRTLFKEVQIRQFAFTFKLIANSSREAEEIKNIIKFFRQELYPEMLTVGDNKVPIAYKFPNVFSIKVKNQFGGDAASKIQRCYLRDVQTSYNATGNGLLEDGNFIEVDISLSFQEVKALDKQMVALEDY